MARSRTKPAVSIGDAIESARPAPSADDPTAQDAFAFEGSDLGAANLAAMAQANAALIEGFEAIGAACYAYARDSFGSAASAARSLIDVRSLVDVVALHHDFTQAALEELIANSARVAEIGVRTTGEALKPLGEHFADTISKLNRSTKP